MEYNSYLPRVTQDAFLMKTKICVVWSTLNLGIQTARDTVNTIEKVDGCQN
jgi:hypothetical protein